MRSRLNKRPAGRTARSIRGSPLTATTWPRNFGKSSRSGRTRLRPPNSLALRATPQRVTSPLLQPDDLSADSRLRPSFAEDGRPRLIDFPIEEIVVAGPGVDFDPTDLAIKIAGMPGRMLLLCCSIRQPAIGTVKKFGGPDTACHGRDDATHRAGVPARSSDIVNDLLPQPSRPASYAIALS
jgi:hypothetical protein